MIKKILLVTLLAAFLSSPAKADIKFVFKNNSACEIKLSGKFTSCLSPSEFSVNYMDPQTTKTFDFSFGRVCIYTSNSFSITATAYEWTNYGVTMGGALSVVNGNLNASFKAPVLFNKPYIKFIPSQKLDANGHLTVVITVQDDPSTVPNCTSQLKR